MKSVLIGSVSTSWIMLNSMIEVGFPINHVFSLGVEYSNGVSDYRPIHELATANGIPNTQFRRISDRENLEIIRRINPDYIFVIGISQLVSHDIISCARLGVVGFHPTPLPKMRGRAAIPWQILLGVHDSKCTVFLIDEGMDSGDILGQEAYTIEESDYAADVVRKVDLAADALFHRVLPSLADGTAKPIKQNDDDATYLMARRPEDGLIDWSSPAKKIERLVRATSRPYPGAYALYDGCHHVTIWRAEYLENRKYFGINGQIASVTDTEIIVICQEGLLRVTEYDNVDGIRIRVGHKFTMGGVAL